MFPPLSETKRGKRRRTENIKRKERISARVQSAIVRLMAALIHLLIILFPYRSSSQLQLKTKMRFKGDIKTYGHGMGRNISILSLENIKWKVCFAKMLRKSDYFSEIFILNGISSSILLLPTYISLMNKNLVDTIIQNLKLTRLNLRNFSRMKTQIRQ
jgi:hypothetical protein